KYGSQAFMVPKGDDFRMVIDMRALNRITRKTPLIMPNLEQQVSFPKGARYLASLDILSGFDYLPVEESSRQYFTLITYFGAFEMCGSPQGWVNTPQLFQNRMVEELLIPANLYGSSVG